MGNVVEISGLNKGYGKKKIVFQDLNLNLESGKIIGLLGPNGSGKTTLIKLLAGLLRADSGNIIIDGIVLNMIDTAGIRETDDIVESIGVKKSLDLINEADLILYVLNNNE